MDQLSIIRSSLLYLFLSGLFYSGLFVTSEEAIASVSQQIAQTVANDEGEDEEDEEDC
jgi:hypothetical protein